MIQRKPPAESGNPIKIVTGKKNCSMVRMESSAASHLVASLELDRQYHDFVKLSPYKIDDTEMTRLLIHGTLHLLGHDHQREEEARAMEAAEEKLWAVLAA